MRAAVRVKELDLSTRVPSFPGAFGALVIPAKKGPVNEPTLVTSDTNFLQVFTPDEKIDVGYDVSHFSALAYLQKSDKLWVVRAANSALYGGLVLRSSTSSYNPYALTTGQSDPTAFVFDENPDVAGVAEVTDVTIPVGASTTYDFNGAAKYWTLKSALDAVSYYVWYNVTDGVNTQTDPNPGGTGIQVDILAADTDIQVAVKTAAAIGALADFNVPVPTTTTLTVTNAATGDTTDAADVDAGVTIVVQTQGVTQVDESDEPILIYGANPGEWNDNVYIKLVNYADSPDVVKEADSFIIYVYKADNLNDPVEQWLCSRIEGKLDGYNNNIYVEDVLEGSNYIRAKDNLLIANTVQPKEISTALALGGGDDGVAVTDVEMIAGVETMANSSQVFVTIFMDGGWTSAAYHLKLDEIAQNRKDCVAILSVPYSAESSSSYLNDIVDYRKTTLNLNSSYSALYSPHPKIYDKFNDRDIYVAPDGYVGAVISATASNFEIWYPPAGFRRGQINVLDLRRRFEDAEMDVLYDAGINPLRFVAGRGILVWGQKTLLSRPSALDRLNVRLLFIALIPALREALEDFVFEINDAQTRFQAASIINSALANYQARRGMDSFSVVADDSNNTPEDIDNYRMNVDVYVVPNKSIEDIPLRTIITRSGIEFSL